MVLEGPSAQGETGHVTASDVQKGEGIMDANVIIVGGGPAGVITALTAKSVFHYRTVFNTSITVEYHYII